MGLFSTMVSTNGHLPEPFTLDDFSSRETVALRAEHVYKTRPNLVARLPSDQGPIVVKWFGWRHPVHSALSPTFLSRAHASWATAQAVKKAQARTPEPLWVLTRRSRGFIKDNFFITRAIHPHTRLRPLLTSDTSDTFLRTAIKDLAGSIARMHNRGIVHRDLTTANFLVDEKGRVFIVDLNRAKQLKMLSPHHRLIDLARLNFKTNTVALTEDLAHLFFDVYRQESGLKTALLEPYREYRKRLLMRKRMKKRVRRLLGRQ